MKGCTQILFRAVLRHILAWDDWLMLPAWACLTTVTVTSLYSTMRLNLTRHLWDVKPEWVMEALRINIIFEILYPIGVALTKVSICLNYLRIFPMQTFNDYFCKGAIIYSVCWCISTMIPQIDQYVNCPPVANQEDRIRINRDCINQQAFLITTAALNSFSDLCIFLWPARFIWGMHVPKDQRLGLVGLFCVGVIICVAGVLRMWFFTVWFKSRDPYWDGVWNYIILALETNVGLICACLPCCKPLLVRLLPCVFSNHESRASARSRENPVAVPSPLDGGGGGAARAVGKKRSWSLWGTGTTLTTIGSRGTGADTASETDNSNGNGNNRASALGKSVGANKSDTVILMDDLGGVQHHHDGAVLDDGHSSITASHEADRSLTVTPQRSTTDVTSLHPDLELGFAPLGYGAYLAVSEDGHPGRKIMP
ncbi:putative integral membrane protein [Neofusicoccum parvum]|uniref:Integral membrane protein n=1 Tax=Neofusicoccum parvum TaxID=310453 RepID=A0ACB5SC28_9PEZI|nr:putative integral membrane protein [Neofusicoccum parvum]